MKRRYIAAGFREDHLAALERAKAKKAAHRAQKAEADTKIINQIREAEDPMEEAFNLLVPGSGAADTQAGELVRAMMKILYRDFNDGDVFYEGYGIETCGDCVAFLCDKIPSLERDFEDIALRNFQDTNYTNAITKIADKVLDHIYENPELVSAKNTEDMYDWDGEDFIRSNEWEPTYEYDVSIPDNVQFHIDRGDLSERDVEWELESWDGLRDADISVQGDTIYIENLQRDDYDEIEGNMYKWLEEWGEDLDSEYGSEYDEEDEDYDEEEE